MARLGPTGMILVPSRAGPGHCPDEFTEIEDIVRGVAGHAGTLVRLDRMGTVTEA